MSARVSAMSFSSLAASSLRRLRSTQGAATTPTPASVRPATHSTTGSWPTPIWDAAIIDNAAPTRPMPSTMRRVAAHFLVPSSGAIHCGTPDGAVPSSTGASACNQTSATPPAASTAGQKTALATPKPSDCASMTNPKATISAAVTRPKSERRRGSALSSRRP